MPRIFRKILISARKAIALDTRALSLFRIGIALVLLADLAIRAQDIGLFYSDDGAVPRSLVRFAAWNPVYFSLHMFSGNVMYIAFLFSLSAVFALLLLAGYRTRLFTILSWLMLVSLHNRNPFILQGGDDLLRNALFWAMFLPLGRHYSADAFSGRAQKGKRFRFTGPAAAGYILLIVSVYFFSALQKHSAEWETEGSALYYALSMDQVALPAGKLLYPYPVLLKILTHLVYVIELLAGIMLLVYRRGQRWRLAGIALLAGLHIGIGFTIYVGLFFIIGLVTLLALLPPAVMDRFDRLCKRFFPWKLRREKQKTNEIAPPAFLRTGIRWFLSATVLYCFAWNFINIPYFPYKLDPPAKIPAALLRIDQNWGMFAPKVFKDDGWYMLEGILPDSSLIDLNRGGAAIDTNKPASIVSMFPNDRHRKYSENLLMTFNDYLRPFYCYYVMKKWNAAHPDRRIITLRLVYMKEVSLPDYETAPVERCVLSECR
ncbi:MAG: HTTM domain-containing protein [Bacteroidetes bacterium]|nr:MAG: HTTM domain-containing protein [Bacteroidota bacterium]